MSGLQKIVLGVKKIPEEIVEAVKEGNQERRESEARYRYRRKQVREEAERLVELYHPETINDLEKIAREEYGIKHIENEHVFANIRAWEDELGEGHIIYYSRVKDYEPFALATAIGAFAVGEAVDEEYGPHGLFARTMDAHYFSRILMQRPDLEYYTIYWINAGYNTFIEMPKQLWKEIKEEVQGFRTKNS